MAVNATAIWRVRPSGSNTNGGGYDPGISGAGTDYSQQNSAQATGVNGTASGTTTFTDTTAANFTSAMVGNAIWIASGAGFTVGAYFIVTFNSSTSVVLDRSPGTGTVAHWAVGGGWADFWTNTDTSGNFGSNGGTWIVPGNIIYILGSGTPNPSAYTFDYTISNYIVPPNGNATAGCITWANDPSTPGYLAPPNTTGGMPVIKTTAGGLIWYNFTFNNFQGLWLVNTGTTFAAYGLITGSASIFGCVADQNATDVSIFGNNQANALTIIGCEIFSSAAPGGPGSQAAILIPNATVNSAGPTIIQGCNIHDTVGYGVSLVTNAKGLTVSNSIIAKCRVDGISIAGTSTLGINIVNCTIDGNTGNGINVNAQADLVGLAIFNNIISNHTGVGKSGVTVGAGTAAANTKIVALFDYNVYYNNTANYTAISAGPHDTAEGTNPYAGQSTENYTLA